MVAIQFDFLQFKSVALRHSTPEPDSLCACAKLSVEVTNNDVGTAGVNKVLSFAS